MKLVIEIRLPEHDESALSAVLGVDGRSLEELAGRIATASFTEYVTMILGQKVFSRGSDLREYRLLLLIEFLFYGRIPTEDEVSRLFQTTTSESQSLIRRVMSKYQYLLKKAIENSLRDLIRAARQAGQGEPFAAVVNSANLVDELNRLLADLDGTLPPVTKQRGSVATYELAPSSHARLLKRLGV